MLYSIFSITLIKRRIIMNVKRFWAIINETKSIPILAGAMAGKTTQAALNHGLYTRNDSDSSQLSNALSYFSVPLLFAGLGYIAAMSLGGANQKGSIARGAFLILALASLLAGILIAGDAFPSIQAATDNPTTGKVLASLAAVVTIPFYGYLGSKPLANSLKSTAEPTSAPDIHYRTLTSAASLNP
jgi:hypothetical protein